MAGIGGYIFKLKIMGDQGNFKNECGNGNQKENKNYSHPSVGNQRDPIFFNTGNKSGYCIQQYDESQDKAYESDFCHRSIS